MDKEMKKYLEQFDIIVPGTAIAEVFLRLAMAEARLNTLYRSIVQVASEALRKDPEYVAAKLEEALQEEKTKSMAEMLGRFGTLTDSEEQSAPSDSD